MILPVWVTFGEGSVTTEAPDGPHWAYGTRGRGQRAFNPRARGNDVWVQTGDLRAADAASDTWEGEAT